MEGNNTMNYLLYIIFFSTFPRKLVANLAHEIIPGHGPAFLVTPAMREALTRQAME